MKILQITKKVPGGGAARIASDLHHQYRERGCIAELALAEPSTVGDSFVLSRQSPHSFWDGPIVSSACDFFSRMTSKMKTRGSDRIRRLKRRMEDLAERPSRGIAHLRGREYFSYLGIWEWAEKLESWPDIIQTHTLEGDFFDLTSLPLLSEKSHLVLTMHNAWMLTGLCAHSKGCERYMTGCGKCPQLVEHEQMWCDGTASNWNAKKQIYSQSKLYVSTPCEWLMQQVKHSMMMPYIKECKVIPNGVDTTVFHAGSRSEARKSIGLDEAATVVLFVANRALNNQWKDYSGMKSAMRYAASKSGRKLIFISVGQEAVAQEEEGVSIIHVGHLDDPADLAKYFRAADIYLHAAVMDTFPNVILEAMACGLPVVATDVGGISEQVRDGCDGVLCPVGDATALGEALIQLFNAPDKRTEMGKSASERVRENFTRELMVDRYVQWFEEIKSSTSQGK